MEYRRIGNTGMEASVVGLGAENLDFTPYEQVAGTIHKAMDLGVNIMDVFMPGEEIRKNIGKALKGRRDKMLIQGHIGSTDVGKQYDISRDLPTCERYFTDLMKHLDTDYIDLGMLFFVDSEKDFEKVFDTEILEYALKLKEKGVIRALGASCHNPVTAKRMVETGYLDTLMFSINPAFDMLPPEVSFDSEDIGEHYERGEGIAPDRAALYKACETRGVAITVMKTLGAGKLVNADHTPFGGPLTVGQCIHYALTRPAVVSTLVGCKTPAEMADAANYVNLTAEERDYTPILERKWGKSFTGSCVYCNHCLPCPANIDIGAVNKYLDIAKLDEGNIPPSIRQHYGALSAHGGDCIACGSCEGRCPFGVSIIENMEKATALFGE
ncbi:aldo/keto reductase [Eubacteriales bacterium OttesenSCG-928-M02]|nr:aldo/keto reductase [Eubacteriales bacterium OttesenSCG-928-M02]